MFKPLLFCSGQFTVKSFIESVFRVLLLFVVMFVLFARVISDGISHDEYQFVASSQLLAMKGQIPYIDYPFLHMPYQIPVYSIAVLLSNYHLFAVRCLNSLFFLVCMLIVFFQITQLLKNQTIFFRNLAGALSIMLILSDVALLGMGGRALNHALPIMLSLLAFAMFHKWIAGNHARLAILGCGFLVGLAIGVRVSFAVLIIPFMFILALDPNFQSVPARIKSISIFAIGLCLSLLPVILLMLYAPNEFVFGNYVYIKLNTIYRQGVFFEEGMTPFSKIQYFITNILTHPSSFVLYLGLFLTALYLFTKLIQRQSRDSIMLFLSVFLSLVLLGSGFAPTPLWPQYFFAPVSFVVISVFAGIAAIPKPYLQRLAIIAITAALIVGFPVQLTVKQITTFKDTAKWVPIQAHNFAQQVQKVVNHGKVVTLAPIYPLESGLETYPPFIVGPFVWRTAPLLSKEGREKYRVTSFHEFEGMLNADPPSAIITGFETDYGFDYYSFGSLEKPFIDYANEYGYQPYETLKLDFWPSYVTLWIKK